jgi:hypothetical protein
MAKKLILIVWITMVLSSCTVYRTISFNENHSGNMDTRIDMTGLVAMMNENGGMGNMGDMSELMKSKEKLESVPGITNVKVSYDSTGILYNSYDFSSPEVLVTAMASDGNMNNMMMGMDQNTDQHKMKISFKGKKFYMEEMDKKTLKSLQTVEKKKEMAQLEMMLASSTMNTTINFPSAVKKVSYKNASITNEKSVNYIMPIKDYLSADYKPLTVILK